jgi:methanogenic corrinoid protein MtbC1
MASVLRYEDNARPVGPGDSRGSAIRRFEMDPGGLSAFRARAEVEFDRALSTLIESEIIPRLMTAHAPNTPATSAGDTRGEPTIQAGEVATLAPLALQVEADALLAHVEMILARGVSVETVMVELLAPTARLLGEFWEDDLCDFVDVTMGLWRLQEVVHEISSRAPAERRVVGGGRRALFASMPGDQHNFGTVVIDELFRRDGWITDRMSDVATPDLLNRVAADWFDMIGLTISCDCHIGPLPSIIVGLRSVSKNPRVSIMVGGRVFSADPNLADKVGADGTARDAKLALEVAGELVRSEREAADCH